jgi:hypothetical protein
VKAFVRIAAIVAGALAIIAPCVWLNVPGSLVLLIQTLGPQRQPVDFDIEFAGLNPRVSSLRVESFYFPKTPIFGITEHYWSMIAPLQIDTITRSLDVAVHNGHVHWVAPLGLVGLSNYRLQSVRVGAQEAPYSVEFSSRQDRSNEPSGLDIPLIAVTGGDYRFDGALALWQRPGDAEANPYVYSPAIGEVSREVIWDGLRTLHARIDLAPYPLATFIVPADWNGAGWKNEAYRATRPGATLTNQALDIATGASIPLPFQRECAAPEFAVASGNGVPKWSRIYGLWRPVPRSAWEKLKREPHVQGIVLRSTPARRASAARYRVTANASSPRVEFVTVLARSSGAYRLFAACPNAHYASLPVTWLDVNARLPSRAPTKYVR